MSGLTSVSVFRATPVDEAIKETIRPFWLPDELVCKIFAFLDYCTLDLCSLVCRQWKRVANDEEVRVDSYLRTRTFGAEKWKAHYGEIGEKTPLPADIRRFLKNYSPFWPGKRAAATTRLIWRPKKVNNVPFNLNTFSEMIKFPLKGSATRFSDYNVTVRAEHGTSTQPSGCWAAITNTVIPHSRRQSYTNQQELVESQAGYTVPGVLDAATHIVTTFSTSGQYIYANRPAIYTRCYEKTGGQDPVVVGAFGPDGLYVGDDDDYADKNNGVGALWRF